MIFGAGALWLALSFFAPPANAGLTTDLQSLSAGLNTINVQLSTLDPTAGGNCGELGTLNTSLEDYIASLDTVTAGLSTPITLTDTDLASLNELSALALTLSGEAVRLSWQLRNIEGFHAVFEYRAALSAMLRLSDDIGTMANRILEMADRILAMADNIGEMADRILITQQLQNANVSLVQAAILTTQQNMVALSDSLSTIAYNLTLGQLKGETGALSDQFGGTTLTADNMAGRLALLEANTAVVLNVTVQLYTTAMLNSQGASHYVDGDTLALLGDLSYLHKALALSLANYAAAIDALAPFTDNIVLRDATASMLRLTRDIGIMSDRMVEMGDKIIVMADNIGVMAGRIVETQNIQQTNIELTQASLLTGQGLMFTVISNFGL